MTNIIAAAAAIGFAALSPVTPSPDLSIDHATQIDHHSGPIDARYRGDVVIRHRQVGSVSPGGRPSTLRCAWAGGMTIAREARVASGATMTRTVSHDAIVTGSHVGWCGSQSKAIAAQVAARRDALDRHVQAVAQEDHAILRAELDRLHGERNIG